MHILRITVLSRGELHTSKRAILKICFDVSDEYCMMYSEKQCAILKDIFYTITNTMRFSFQQYHLLWKGRCMRKRIHFWHRSRHVLVKWNALPFEKKCTCWREHSFQRDAKVISRKSFNVFEHVLFEGFGSTMSISNSVAQTHSLCMFWHSLLAYFETWTEDKIA